MADERLEVRLRRYHDGITPAWVASARGESCGSEVSANDAVLALIDRLLTTGAITEDVAAGRTVASG